MLVEELSLTTLPERIFFTGVPGSRWSGIAREIKSEGHYNCTDRAPHRAYKHHNKVGHTEAYYGTGMEFDVSLDRANLDAPYSSWDNSFGCKLHMSHEWVYCFREIQYVYPLAWIQLVYRPDWESFVWWKEAGGFSITYPNYGWYSTEDEMLKSIKEQNQLILDFAQKYRVQWVQHNIHNDIFIGTYKP